MTSSPSDTDELLGRIAVGDTVAVDQLLARFRDRLRQMVAWRMDPRLSGRVDPSDVVQESLIVATQKLPDYIDRRPIPFYPWLRQIAWDHLVRLHERHVVAQKRSVNRETHGRLDMPERSAVHLAERLVSGDTSPSRQLLRKEVRGRVRGALDQMAPTDREVLAMWYLEQLSASEIAAVLGLTVAGVKSRHRRALQRMLRVLESEETES